MRRAGKVKGQTPRVHSDKIPSTGKPHKRGKRTKHSGSSGGKKIMKNLDNWEDRNYTKKSKKNRKKLERRHRMKTNQSSKSSDRRRKKILTEYNDFFEYFNLPRVNDYSQLITYLEKKEVSVLLNEEERLKCCHTTNWKRNRNYKLLANVCSFEGTHEILRKKFNICQFLVDSLFQLLDDVVESKVDDDENDNEDIDDTITDIIRSLANISLNENFVSELFNDHRLFEKLLLHKYFPYCIISRIPHRIQVERSKILSSLSIEPKIFPLLKKKSSKMIEPLLDLTQQKGMIGEFMQIFWTWVVFHEDDFMKKGESEDEEGEGEEESEEEGKEEEEGDPHPHCAGPLFNSPFIENFVPESNQELVKSRILTVCEVLDEYAENLIRVEIPSDLLVSKEDVAEDLKFPHSPRRTGAMMFRTIYRGSGLGGGGGKVHKPVIYLYPPTTKPIPNVSVDLDFQGGAGLPSSGLTITIPDVQNWNSLEVREGSKIRDLTTRKVYDYLFYEGNLNTDSLEKISSQKNVDFSTVVSKSDVEEFLRRSVTKMGLVGSEVDDFLEYWCPVLKNLPMFASYEICFLGNEKWGDYSKLDISPKPQLTIRLFMTFRGIEDDGSYEKPSDDLGLPNFEVSQESRDGKFVVVEWGGMQII